eukprot:3082947-Pyramimonas_sp.AAC.1
MFPVPRIIKFQASDPQPRHSGRVGRRPRANEAANLTFQICRNKTAERIERAQMMQQGSWMNDRPLKDAAANGWQRQRLQYVAVLVG